MLCKQINSCFHEKVENVKKNKNQPGIKDLFAKASERNARNNNENSLPVEEENNFTEYETKNRGSASRIHQPKGGPPLDFINQMGVCL